MHALFLLLFLLTEQQIYTFYSSTIMHSVNLIEIIKINNTITSMVYGAYNILDYNYLNKNSQVVFDLFKNNFDFLFGLNKGIFEKNMIIYNNTLLELYNYNFQKLVQTDGFNIFILFIFVLLLSMLILKKKQACVIM